MAKNAGEYSLYLASGIKLWKDYFRNEYSKYFNRKVKLFEPGTMGLPVNHREIPISIACYDLDKINHSDALLVYMKNYTTPDGSPQGTDSTWECGYAIAKGKPVIMLIENKEHIDYFASQWMVSFSINAILTADKDVARIVKNHPKFVHARLLTAQNPEQFETKIIEYLDGYYKSIYSRSGMINYHVDERARELFSNKKLDSIISKKLKPDQKITSELSVLRNLEFKSDKDSLLVCRVERNISNYLDSRITESIVDSAISSVIKEWNKPKNHVISCLLHSIKPPFEKIEGRKQGVKKTRPEFFFELYDLVTHHIIREKMLIKSESFPYDMGAVTELYNWMNTYALDDVFDNSKYRQNLETVWNEFSRPDAIYTGILGHLLAIKYVFIITSENPRLAKILAEIMNEYNRIMYEGQVIDIVLTFDSESKKKILRLKPLEDLCTLYIQRIYGICGGFYESIGELSSKAGNKEEQVMNAKDIDRISPAIGMYYGIIQMIRNDLGDYIMPEDFSELSKGMKDVSHSDIEEGKTNVAYLISMHSGCLSKDEKEFLYRALHKKLSKDEKIKINELLWKAGSIDLVVDLIIAIIEHVKTNLLSEFHETPTRMKWMFDMVEITKNIIVPFRKQALKYKWIKYEYDTSLLEKLKEIIMGLETKNKKERLGKLNEFEHLL